MKFNKTVAHLTLVLVATLLTQRASADIILTYSIDDGATFSDSFDITTGDSLTVEVYLRESSPDTVLSAEGLLGFGLVAATSPANLGIISAASIAPAFDTPSNESFTDSTIDWKAIAFASPPVGQAISLGEFQYDSTADGMTLFTFSDHAPGSGGAVTDWLSAVNGTPLDEVIFGAGATGNFQLTINAASAVPEPSSCLVLLLSGVVAMSRRRRSR